MYQKKYEYNYLAAHARNCHYRNDLSSPKRNVINNVPQRNTFSHVTFKPESFLQFNGMDLINTIDFLRFSTFSRFIIVVSACGTTEHEQVWENLNFM